MKCVSRGSERGAKIRGCKTLRELKRGKIQGNKTIFYLFYMTKWAQKRKGKFGI